MCIRDRVNAVARDLGVSANDVMEMEKRLNVFDASFDGPVDGDPENDGFSPAGYLEDGRASPEEQLAMDQVDQANRQKLSSALLSLDKRSQEIIRQRWLNEDKTTLHSLAAEYGVSAERIRQLEQNAMQKMRLAFAD